MKKEKVGTLGDSHKNDVIEELSESDDEIEQQKPVAPIIKQKRVPTDKQKEILAKGRELRDTKRKERLTEKQKQDEEYKKELESKIVKKAIAIKKKQIRKHKVIEPTPSDEEDDDEPQPPPRKVKVYNPKPLPTLAIQPTPRQPKIIFI